MNNTIIKAEIVAQLKSAMVTVTPTAITDIDYSKDIELLSSTFDKAFDTKHNVSETKITHNYSIQVKSATDSSTQIDNFIDHWIDYSQLLLSSEVIYPLITGYSAKQEDTLSNVYNINLSIAYTRLGR